MPVTTIEGHRRGRPAIPLDIRERMLRQRLLLLEVASLDGPWHANHFWMLGAEREGSSRRRFPKSPETQVRLRFGACPQWSHSLGRFRFWKAQPVLVEAWLEVISRASLSLFSITKESTSCRSITQPSKAERRAGPVNVNGGSCHHQTASPDCHLLPHPFL
jgi:hypothetical protein